jgi:hypothetical protein
MFVGSNPLFKRAKFARFYNDDTQELVVDMNYIVLDENCVSARQRESNHHIKIDN